jgi:hypothetical protein
MLTGMFLRPWKKGWKFFAQAFIVTLYRLMKALSGLRRWLT